MTRRATSEVVLLDTGNYPGQANFFNTTFTRSGGVWTKVSASDIDPSGPLPLRTDHAMAYDGANVVLYGGRAASELGGVLQDHWRWNGTNWLAVSTTVPFGRYKHKMAYLSGSSGAVMFGGRTVNDMLLETWICASGTWTQQKTTHTPPARVDHAMAASTTIALLFGGATSNSALNDTWSFASGDWTKLSPTGSPSVRAGAAMAYDVSNSVYVLFGGKNESGLISPTDCTYTFDGTNWTKRSPTTSPSAREGAQMSWDGTNCILFGGAGATDADNQLWKWDHSALNWVAL
jgi:hypothetical protein